jgi:hypothetical protein
VTNKCSKSKQQKYNGKVAEFIVVSGVRFPLIAAVFGSIGGEHGNTYWVKVST